MEDRDLSQDSQIRLQSRRIQTPHSRTVDQSVGDILYPGLAGVLVVHDKSHYTQNAGQSGVYQDGDRAPGSILQIIMPPPTQNHSPLFSNCGRLGRLLKAVQRWSTRQYGALAGNVATE